jgi:hypothetical protein
MSALPGGRGAGTGSEAVFPRALSLHRARIIRPRSSSVSLSVPPRPAPRRQPCALGRSRPEEFDVRRSGETGPSAASTVGSVTDTREDAGWSPIPGAQRSLPCASSSTFSASRLEACVWRLAPEACLCNRGPLLPSADIAGPCSRSTLFAALPRARVFRDEAVRLAAWRLRAFGAFLFGVASRCRAPEWSALLRRRRSASRTTWRRMPRRRSSSFFVTASMPTPTSASCAITCRASSDVLREPALRIAVVLVSASVAGCMVSTVSGLRPVPRRNRRPEYAGFLVDVLAHRALKLAP